ncbi:hypothetical protein [Desulfofarcimen acetoxidans]|nr:hypothetical protein [Desulfofarcimen acetoxidans]
MILLQGILELTGVAAFSLAVVRVPLYWGRITALGILLFAVTYTIRILQTTFGLHTAILLFLLSLLIRKVTHTSPVQSFKGSFLSLITLTLLELVIYKIFVMMTKYDPDYIISNIILWKSLGLPQGILMIIFAIIISKYKKPYEGAWRI